MSNTKSASTNYFPFFIAAPAVVWQVMFMYVPLTFGLWQSFTRSDGGLFSFTLENYRQLFALAYAKIIGRSLLLASGTSVACLLLAYPIAYYITMRARRHKNTLLFFFVLPFWVNFLVQVYAWFFMLENNGLINTVLLKLNLISNPIPMLNSMFAVYVVMVYCYLPFMIMPIYNTLDRFNRRLIEASKDLGASSLQTFWKITLPMSMRGIATGVMLVFIVSFGEYAIPVLMSGDKHIFVGSLISHYFLVTENAHLGSAFTCIAIAVVALASLLITLSFFRRRHT